MLVEFFFFSCDAIILTPVYVRYSIGTLPIIHISLFSISKQAIEASSSRRVSSHVYDYAE